MQKKILIVDDQRLLSMSLARTLRNQDYRVEIAESGQDGLQLFERISPDLVLLDIWLPDSNGMTILRKMHKSSPETPIVILSAHDDPELVNLARRLKAREYVNKPFDTGALLGIVRRELRGRNREMDH